jgi:hypothetical protein
MSMILLEPPNKVTHLSVEDQAADHLINRDVRGVRVDLGDVRSDE